MLKTVGIGVQNFEKIITNDIFYIDKTPFIKEWWESGDDVTLITRPRRFGKTLNINMLEYFFSIQYANKGDLFENLSIWKEEIYRNLQGTYPVISLSFADIKRTDYESVKQEIYYLLVKLYEKNRFLLDSDLLTDIEKELFQSISMDMNEVIATRAIQSLCEYLYRYYGKKVILLLDEYDTPMQEAYVNGFWEELVSFIRNFFNTTFKTNPYLLRAVMTGITRVSKESIFSDLNNLEVVTTTSDKYATYFGFTEEEVFTALEMYGLGMEKEEVKAWYDGFIFGEQKDIYNPWSILNFLDKGKYSTYWANTSSNGLVSKLIREGNKTIKHTFEELLRGKTIRCPIDEQIVYNQLDDNHDAIWSLLVASGYLKVVSYEQEDLIEEEAVMYELTLTNFEVKRMFYNMVRGWFGKAKEYYNEFIRALLRNDVEEMNEYMNRVALNTFSYFDTGNSLFGDEPERFYHGFVIGLLVDLNKEYIVLSNRESGFGRYDVMIEPKEKEKDAFILEFKVHDPEEENSLKDTVQKALQQIEDKQYETLLIAKGILGEHIHRYGFAFEGKTILIGGQ